MQVKLKPMKEPRATGWAYRAHTHTLPILLLVRRQDHEPVHNQCGNQSSLGQPHREINSERKEPENFGQSEACLPVDFLFESDRRKSVDSDGLGLVIDSLGAGRSLAP